MEKFNSSTAPVSMQSFYRPYLRVTEMSEYAPIYEKLGKPSAQYMYSYYAYHHAKYMHLVWEMQHEDTWNIATCLSIVLLKDMLQERYPQLSVENLVSSFQAPISQIMDMWTMTPNYYK